MTREKAIEMLKYNSNVIHKTINGETDPNEVAALDMAIKALEQKPCEDAISRQAAIDAIIKRDANCGIYSVEVLKTLPSVTQKPKPGHWITEDMFDGGVAYRCSECGELFWIVSGTPKTNEYNFCPKCGTMLIEPQESEG